MKILGTKVTAAKADTPTTVKSEGVYEQAENFFRLNVVLQ